jgi:hypothetical protein
MSHWCASHPRYEAKRPPGSLCGECWKLYLLRCPEHNQEGENHATRRPTVDSSLSTTGKR